MSEEVHGVQHLKILQNRVQMGTDEAWQRGFKFRNPRSWIARREQLRCRMWGHVEVIRNDGRHEGGRKNQAMFPGGVAFSPSVRTRQGYRCNNWREDVAEVSKIVTRRVSIRYPC
jgi:hypothetical protein